MKDGFYIISCESNDKKMFPTTGKNFGIACILIKVDSIDVFANYKDTHFNCV